MAKRRRFAEPMDAEASGMRSVRWRVLLVHDANANTCDTLGDAILEALGGTVEVEGVASVHSAVESLANRYDLCFVCLDLPPAPTGGVRVAEQAMSASVPVILVTRSQRWIPMQAARLRALPWVAPDAAAAQVQRAIADALATQGGSVDWPTEEAPNEPARRRRAGAS